MAQIAEVIVVGGGIWGLSTAYHLAKLGQTGVCVLERNPELARETTPQAAGLVGQIRATPTMSRAIRYALHLLSRFGAETGHDAGLRQTGSLMIALVPERMAAYRRQLDRARQLGIEADWVDRPEMSRLAPALDVSKVEGAYFISKDGYIDPLRCALSYAAAAKDLGVSIRLGSRVTGFKVRGERVVGVETTDGTIEAPHVVVTAGPWTGVLAAKAGFRPAMQPIRHQRVRTVAVPGIPEHHPVVRVTDVSCYLRPEQGGYLYGFFEPKPLSIDLEASPPEFRTADIEPPVEVMAEARRRLAPVFPILQDLAVAEHRQGMTTFAPDGSYLIGPVPGVGGLYVAAGCAALGIAGSAAVGRWLAKWIVEGSPGEDLADFGLTRFGDRAGDPELIRRESEQFYASYYAIRA